MNFHSLFYPIIDAQFATGDKTLSLATQILQGGAKILQYRDKTSSDTEFTEISQKLLILCHKFGAKLIINDRLEIAKEIGADGVHMGWEDVKQIRNSKSPSGLSAQMTGGEILNKFEIPNDKFQIKTQKQSIIPLLKTYLGGQNKILGLTARNLKEALWAQSQGADYIGCSAVFKTKTKTDAPPMGLEGLKNLVKHVKIPTIAIGGINKENARDVLKTGVSGLAVVSAICLAKNPKKETEEWIKIINPHYQKTKTVS